MCVSRSTRRVPGAGRCGAPAAGRRAELRRRVIPWRKKFPANSSRLQGARRGGKTPGKSAGHERMASPRRSALRWRRSRPASAATTCIPRFSGGAFSGRTRKRAAECAHRTAKASSAWEARAAVAETGNPDRKSLAREKSQAQRQAERKRIITEIAGIGGIVGKAQRAQKVMAALRPVYSAVVPHKELTTTRQLLYKRGDRRD